jgi:deoxyxylulose-5-phosphate synthase
MESGGFGEYALSLAMRENCKSKTVILAVQSRFFEEALGTREQLLAGNSLDGTGIAKTVKQFFKGGL